MSRLSLLVHSRSLALIVALAALAQGLAAQDSPSDIPEAFRDKALAVRVNTTVIGKGETPWEDSVVKYTIPGTPVGIRLVSDDLIVFVQLTAYQGVPQRLVLVTQGQVWIRDGAMNVRYHTTLNTIPIAFGEKIFFYPLGIEGKGPAPVTVSITVEPFKPGDAPLPEAEKTKADEKAKPGTTPIPPAPKP